MSTTTTFMWFPGQGAQFQGMGKVLAKQSEYVDSIFDEATEQLDFDLKQLLWQTPDNELAQTQNAQPALVAVSAASFLDWKQTDQGKETLEHSKVWVSGHSVGAISAAVAGGYLSFVEGVKLARARGNLMANCPGHGGMLAVRVSGDEHREEMFQLAKANELDVATINGERQIVIAGDYERLTSVQKEIGGRSVMLNVSHAFHSKMMDPAIPKWNTLLDETTFEPSQIGYFGTCSGKFAADESDVKEDLAEAIRRPVRWDLVIEASKVAETGFIFGPGKFLAKLWRERPIKITVVDEGRKEIV